VSDIETDPSGIIFDIQRFSVHDGPGIRTLVFLKGCPLACPWCSNPESQRFPPDLLFDASRCVACGGCVEACPHGAIRTSGSGLAYDRERCEVCGACAEACPAEARTVAGRRVTASAVVAEVLRDAPFFANSGGGVTLGGGEPLAQSGFSREILRGCRHHGLHTVIETCGHVPWPAFETILPLTDLFLYDLKHIDGDAHAAQTAGNLSLILSNLARLAEAQANLIVRVPIVPGFNDTPDTIRAIADHVVRLGIGALHLLPYHRLGESKYRLLGQAVRFESKTPPTAALLQDLQAAAARENLAVRIGG
jgi:pyruvate formate lyase activating enzyme